MRIFCVNLFLLFISGLRAQPPCSTQITACGDVHVCQGNSATISVDLNGGNYLFGSWSPAAGLSDPNSLTTTVSPSQTTSYIYSAYQQQTELIQNGNFSSGNTGFTSNYHYNPGDLWSEANYDIITDPSSSHSMFSSCGDHTTGSGNMMVINGAGTPNISIYCQSVTVTPNTYYSFSTWLCSVYPGSPATLQFSINGVLLGKTPLIEN